MFLSEWREFPSAYCLAGKKNLMTARVSMLLKSRASLTCFRASFFPCRATDLSAPRYLSCSCPVLPVTCPDHRSCCFPCTYVHTAVRLTCYRSFIQRVILESSYQELNAQTYPYALRYYIFHYCN